MAETMTPKTGNKAEATYQINEMMNDDELILVYQDDFSDESFVNLLRFAEKKITSQEESKKLKKRLFHILVECVQNISRHKSKPQKSGEGETSILAIGKNKSGYSIITGNAIEKEKVLPLKKNIDMLNSLTPEQLKNIYLKTMQNGEHNSAGGASLGLMDMLRKADGKIEYGFRHYDERNDFLSFKICLGS